jgi:hypothetical protein
MPLVLTGNSSTITVDSTNGITFPNNTLQVSAGIVLQVVSTTSASSFSTSSGSFVDAGYSAAITPRFSTSKILLMFSSNNILQAGNMSCALTFARNTTLLDSIGFAQLYAPSGTTTAGASGVFLDSPATTSSITYRIYCRNQNNNGTVQVNTSAGLASFVLMEIAG